jgi:hypothetical protein
LVPGARSVAVTHSNAGRAGRRRCCLTKIVENLFAAAHPTLTHSGIKESHNRDLRRKMRRRTSSSVIKVQRCGHHSFIKASCRCHDASLFSATGREIKRRPRNAAS